MAEPRALVTSVFFSVFLSAGVVFAQSSETYPKAQGGTITLPHGRISFADSVARFDEGMPSSLRPLARQPTAALGPPDRREETYSGELEFTAVTIGCRGSITLEFTNNALIDIDGPDLHVWEVGEDVEPTGVEISRNGTDWIAVGAVSGSTANLDIAGKAVHGASYRFVRLTDLDCLSPDGDWPGADIDAVAAVGTAERFVFEAGVLFAFDEAVLSEAAKDVLRRFVGDLTGRRFSRLEIIGHTDSKGSDAYNLHLSMQRARAVSEFLSELSTLKTVGMTTHAAGESEPIAANDTDEGRQRNRRVEIILIP